MSKDIYKDYEELLPGAILEEVKREAEKAKLTSEQIKDILKEVKDSYDRSLISPGEDIGIVTAESFGEPGTQMSILSSTEIIIKLRSNLSGDKIHIVKIGEFIDRLMSMFSIYIKKFKDSDVLSAEIFDVYVPSLDKDEKIQWKKVVEISRHRTEKELLKLKTRSGREITATDNHSFVVRKHNTIIPIIGEELKVGDRIPIIKNLITQNPTEFIQIADENDIQSKQAVIANGMVTSLLSEPITQNLVLDWLSGWFIGAYLSEGYCVTGRTVGISNINENYIDNAKNFITQLGLNYKDRFYHGQFGESRLLTTNSKFLARFVEKHCGKGSNNKKVPDFAFNAKEEFISGLLRGYFDGDWNVSVSRKVIRASSNSEKLIKGVALLLSRFNIFTRINKDKKGQFWVVIPYGYAKIFLEKIGSDLQNKKSGLIELAKMSDEREIESLDQIEMVSGFDDLFYSTAKKLGMRARYINNFTKRHKIGKFTLARYIKKFEKLAQGKKIDINEELKIMEKMLNSDVVWDEIVKIEYVNPSEYVYDLSVPGLETFTTFDGIITHNTLNVFHFAGVSEMQVTEGLPRLIEIFDAREHPNKPIINVYLTKEHTKDDKTIRKMASLIKEIKLEGISSQFSLNLLKGTVEIQLDIKKIADYGLAVKDIISVLEEQLKIDVKELKNKVVLTPKEGESSLGDVFKLKEKAKSVIIRGIKGITQVLPVRKDNELVILCAGTNFKEVLALEGVDEKRTYTNDIHEIAKVLGIEAARQAIINESLAVIESQGLDIDIRHTLFLADLMTTTGKVKGITRGGITGEKESVLARATFETPIIHLVNASMIAERDNLNSVIENVIINQPVPLGTGLPGLIAKKIKGGKS